MDEIKISVSMPLDSDSFLRRECPTCEQEFKWFNHDEGDVDAEPVDQYFCPRCGQPSGIDTWWTQAQIEYGQRLAGPEIDQLIQDSVADMFKSSKFIEFKPDPRFTLGIPTPEPLVEPDDMVIVEPPCHPHEPLKVPEEATARVFCLICGSIFVT